MITQAHRVGTLISLGSEKMKDIEGKIMAYHQLQREDHVSLWLDETGNLLSKDTGREKTM